MVVVSASMPTLMLPPRVCATTVAGTAATSTTARATSRTQPFIAHSSSSSLHIVEVPQVVPPVLGLETGDALPDRSGGRPRRDSEGSGARITADDRDVFRSVSG